MKKKYTAKDKIMFEKLENLIEKSSEFKEKLTSIKENEKNTYELIGLIKKFLKFNLDMFDSKSQETFS